MEGGSECGVFYSHLNLIGLKHDCWDTGLLLVFWDLCSYFPGANVTSSRYKFSKNFPFRAKRQLTGKCKTQMVGNL